MKKIWMGIRLISVSLACTLQVGAGFIDMGGFQIQVEQKKDTEVTTETQTEQDDDEEQVWVPPTPKETISAVEEQTEDGETEVQQAETPIPGTEGWETSHKEEESATEQETEEICIVLQQDTEAAEEDIVFVSEEDQTEADLQEKEGQEVIEPVQEEQEKERDVQQKSTGRKDKKKTEKEKIEDIRFVHEDLTRLSDKGSLAVRLEGDKEVCVLSCAVNHKECAYKWERGCLVPLDTSIQKGVNCLEISVLLPDGQVISMDPWYFSCGVGLAVL